VSTTTSGSIDGRIVDADADLPSENNKTGNVTVSLSTPLTARSWIGDQLVASIIAGNASDKSDSVSFI
jgi:hypothetical protein